MRQCIEDYDADAGVEDMLNDYHEVHFDEGRGEYWYFVTSSLDTRLVSLFR